MAKSRARETSRDRTRPPRMSGMGLMQVTLLGGFAAVVFTIVAVLGAGSSTDDTASRNADSFATGMAAVLTAPEPEWWLEYHSTTDDMLRTLRRYYAALDPGKPTAEAKKRRDIHNGTLRVRNKKRLENAVPSIARGALRGLQIRSSDPKRLGDHSWGARIRAGEFTSTRTLGKEISVGRLTASGVNGTFAARVYHRPYRDARDVQVGDVYVILEEAALQPAGGAGMWLFLGPLLVAIAAGLLVFQAARTSDGLKGLARDLDTIGRGKLDLRVHAQASGEVGFLQRTVDRMASNLQLIQTTGSGDLDEAIEKELDLATQIHQSLRPSDPPRVPGYELETLFKMGRDIGGDYYDYIELDENRLAIVIADCSESLRGVPAAMVMAMTRAYLKTAIDPDSGPTDWLRVVNRRLARDLKSGMAVTAQVAVLNHSSHEVIAASAGHRPMILWRKGKTATINPNGIALGLDVGPVFDKTMEEKKFSLQKNDRLVLHTDGVIAAENDSGEAYGEPRFLEAVRRQGAMNSAAFVNFIGGGVDKFLAGNEQTDDITVTTLKRMK